MPVVGLGFDLAGGDRMTEEAKVTWTHCNLCGHETKHDVLLVRRRSESELVDALYGIEVSWSRTHTLLECRGCEEATLLRTIWCSEDDPEDGPSETYFPPRVSRRRPTWFDELPSEYAGLLKEIYTALDADSRRLAMMGLRAVIDLFMARKLEGSSGFAGGLRQLVAQNYLTTRSLEIVEAAVEAGHASAHRAHNPTAIQVNAVMDIVENLIQHDLLAESAASLRRTIPRRPSKEDGEAEKEPSE